MANFHSIHSSIHHSMALASPSLQFSSNSQTDQKYLVTSIYATPSQGFSREIAHLPQEYILRICCVTWNFEVNRPRLLMFTQLGLYKCLFAHIEAWGGVKRVHKAHNTFRQNPTQHFFKIRYLLFAII